MWKDVFPESLLNQQPKYSIYFENFKSTTNEPLIQGDVPARLTTD